MFTICGKSISVPAPFSGVADFILDIPSDRPIRILQLSDMQIIDASQQRFPGRLNDRENALWQPETIPIQCTDLIRSVVAQSDPDLIIITGDIVYGEFDDSGSSLEQFCDFLNNLGIPWAPVYGNHDNESLRGVDWQNSRLEYSPLCLFKKGNVTGNGNYSILLTRKGIPFRALYMMNSGGCIGSSSESARRCPGFGEDQYNWLYSSAEGMHTVSGVVVPSFICFHIPTIQFHLAAVEKGYQTPNEWEKYVIGVTSPAKDGDSGCKREPISCIRTPDGFVEKLNDLAVDGVFAGHCHANNTSVLWNGIRWTYGLKTGHYDYHTVGQVGGTLITLWDKNFSVVHITTLAPIAPVPNPPRY